MSQTRSATFWGESWVQYGFRNSEGVDISTLYPKVEHKVQDKDSLTSQQITATNQHDVGR